MKKMSIRRQAFLEKIVAGLLWIGAGITGMSDEMVWNIVHIIFLTGAAAILLVMMLAKREENDEMSEYNYMKAQAMTTNIMHAICCMISIGLVFTVDRLLKWDINWALAFVRTFFIIIGSQDLITGVVFWRLEAE